MATDILDYNKLRTLAATHPGEARRIVEAMLDSQAATLPDLLIRMGAPGEGRLRQLIANTVRARPERAASVPCLQSWFDVETDEFAKRALRSALESLHVEQVSPVRSFAPVDPRLVEAYRFAVSRISHRLRNAMDGPQSALERLQTAVTRVSDAAAKEELSGLTAKLSSGLRLLGRVAAFNATDDHFRFRRVLLPDWIRSMNSEYARKYEPIELEIEEPTDGVPAAIVASHHLLETIFWNLWTNAHQAAEAVCQIKVKIEVFDANVRATVRDNGEGIPTAVADVAFRQPFSTKEAAGRGQGLLEVQDAVEQLRGLVLLTKGSSAGYWVELSFPMDMT